MGRLIGYEYVMKENSTVPKRDSEINSDAIDSELEFA